jgi:hypothetical protein
MAEPRLFTLEELAAARHESYGTVRNRVAKGEVAAIRHGNRGIRITEGEFQRVTQIAPIPITARPQTATG